MGAAARLVLLLGIAIGYFMVLLDMTVVSVALPAIHDDLGGGISELQWVVNAYTIVFAGLLLSMGTAADKAGAKRIYMIGLALFLAASAMSAFAPSLGVLIAMRALLGVGGAALLPASLTLIAHAFPDPGERARALGIWAAVTGIALAAGPVAGGLLVDSFGWRSIFILNIPLAILSLLITRMNVTETNRNPKRSFDLAGQLLAIVFIAALSFVLMEGEPFGWSSPVIWGTGCLALLAIIGFIIVEAKSRSPLLPLHIFRSSTVSAGMLAGTASNIALSGILFVLPMFYQQMVGLSAHSAGLAMLPMMVPMAVNPIFAGRIVSRTGARIPMTGGFAAVAAGTVLLALADENTNYAQVCAGLFLIGFGISFTLPSLMSAILSSVPRELTGAASGALNASRQVGATLGVAVVGAIISGSETFITGMHVSLIVTAVILAGGSLLSFLFINRDRRT